MWQIQWSGVLEGDECGTARDEDSTCMRIRVFAFRDDYALGK
jgi:hypothetical protein